MMRASSAPAQGSCVSPLGCRWGRRAAGRTALRGGGGPWAGGRAASPAPQPWPCGRDGPASPAVLMPLLEYCSVRPDATVAAHRFFGPDAEIRYRLVGALGRVRAWVAGLSSLQGLWGPGHVGISLACWTQRGHWGCNILAAVSVVQTPVLAPAAF